MSIHNFKGFKNDSRIIGIGNYFRSINHSRWNIDLKLSPKQSKDFTTTSNASQLIRGHVINPVKEKNTKGWCLPFRIDDATKWETKTIGDCPIIRSEKGLNPHQFCFVFTITDGTTVYLPHFELARTLFFHGSYLSRTALESECLKTDFAVDVGEDENAMIRVLDPSSFSVKRLNEPKTRNYLAWLLLNSEALQSYESITRYQRQKGQDSKQYRRWNFQFTPPSLKNVNLYVGGQFCRDNQSLFVYEIKEIAGVPNKHFKSICMWHPDFEHSVPGEGHMVQPAGGTQEDSLTIHDDVTPNANMQPILLEGSSVSFEFQNSFHVTKTTTKETTRPSIHTNDETKGSITSVSTEEGAVDQSTPGGDWNTLQDDTDYEQFFENKFDCFRSMVKILIETYGCVQVSKLTSPLPPNVGRCKKHLLSTTGESRYIAIIGLQVGEKTVHLLEVDTSDADKSLSTQVLVVKNLVTWETDIKKLKRELLQSSLRWPKELLDDLCGKDHHNGVKHPQAPAGNKGVLELDSIAGWASRIYSWMNLL